MPDSSLVVGMGLTFAPAAHAGALFQGVVPFAVACLAAFVLREPVPSIGKVGFALIACGAAIIGGLAVSGLTIGHALFLSAALLTACYPVAIRRAGIDGLHAAAIAVVASLLFYLPTYFILFDDDLFTKPAADLLFQALYQGGLTAAVSLALYGQAIRCLGASKAAAFVALGPTITALMGTSACLTRHLSIDRLHCLYGFKERSVMSTNQSSLTTHIVATPSGRVCYVETGSGPVALFVHGVLMNKHLWRHQLVGLSDIRRCIAVDLLAHGSTEIAPDQDVSVTANAAMLREFLDALKIDQVDLVGNDSGGGISQIFAATNAARIRSLTLTDCDTHNNWPPEAFKPFLEMAAAGGLPDTLKALLADKSVYRSPGALGPAYEHPEKVTDADIETYLRPFLAIEQRVRDLQRFCGAFDNRHTLAIESHLRQLKAPTLIVWGTDDVYFPVNWAHWLHGAIPGAKPPVIYEGARLFFIEERADDFNRQLRAHWQAA